jgi:CheY-like chemotaxis protein
VLAGGIAHDFNNFLTIIAGNIALAKMQLKPADQVCDILEQAAVACNRAKSLALQLLTFGKGGAPVKRPSPLCGVLKDAVDLARAGATATINLTIGGDLWSAEIDPEQISQALYNILPRIFDPYFTTKQSGSGLGLATVHAIVAKHDGHITVQSILGAETTFSVYLPACRPVQPAESGVGQQMQTGSGRVLVMDDEEALCMLLAQILKRLGYEVECARDGAEAIWLYQKAKDSGRRFDVVLVDLTIPGGIGGEEVAARLRKIDDSVVLIVSSGYSNTPIMSEFRKYGFDDALSKPWSPVDLSEVLRRHTQSLGKSKTPTLCSDSSVAKT